MKQALIVIFIHPQALLPFYHSRYNRMAEARGSYSFTVLAMLLADGFSFGKTLSSAPQWLCMLNLPYRFLVNAKPFKRC